MTTTKATLVAFALIAGLACVQAAGGIKGRQQPDGSLQRVQAVKGLRPPSQQYLPPPPPPPPQPIALPAPVPQQAIKAGPGQVAPIFNAIRVQPAPLPAPAPLPVQQFQQVQAPLPVQQFQQVQVPVPVQQAQLVQEQEPEIVQQQQQLPAQIQEQEIDPNADAQDASPAVIAPARQAPVQAAAAAAPAASEEEANPRPEPYSFQYNFDSGDSATSGSSTREESQDASGRVTGFYTLKGEDGRDRRVDYVADASGFRATVRSNEMGTADKDSADVDWQVQAPSEGQLRAAESATQLARQRALLNPQPLAQASQQQQSVQFQQQQPIASASSQSQQKFSSPRQRGAAASSQQLSKVNLQPQPQQQQQQQQVQISQQLQEPFEQIRQTELNTRARKSRHAPFYLYTV